MHRRPVLKKMETHSRLPMTFFTTCNDVVSVPLFCLFDVVVVFQCVDGLSFEFDLFQCVDSNL